MFSPRTYDSNESEMEYDSYNEDNEEHDSSVSEEQSDEYSSDTMEDVEVCSWSLCMEKPQFGDMDTCSIDRDDLFTVHVGVEEADPLCIKIQDLLRRGKISKDKIFYKYMSDVVEIMYNPFHEYDREVVEFLNTITYLGGKRTACFIRGPMNMGDGRNSHMQLMDKKMNLGGPSETVCAKYQARYTESGVIKPLSLGHIELLKNSQAKSLIKIPDLITFPCALGNDGTALKPAIEFDSRLKENVGLKIPVDINYLKANPSPSPDRLKENIVTEAIVSSLTSLDNFCCLPVAVDYVTQSGKTGETMTSMFEEHIKTLQLCKSCQKRATHQRHIITSQAINCSSFCDVCYLSKTVCEECSLQGQVSHVPSLRFCDSCHDNNSVCVRRVVMIVCSDCESGNKTAFEIIKAKLDAGNEDPELAFLSILPDCPHVGKSMKAVFSNWWLKCRNERINLAAIRTLRNRSDKATRDKFRKLIPKNDHVKNKDRQDPSAVLTLTNKKFTDELRNASYVCHTIIPELDKYSSDNQLGMYPSPISIAIPSYGWIAFLSYDVKSSMSTLFKARLHSPVDKISPIARNLEAKEIHCSDGIIFLVSHSGPIKAIEFIEGSISIKTIISKLRKKKDVIEQAEKLHVRSTGSVAEIRARLLTYIRTRMDKYSENHVTTGAIHFWDRDSQPSFEAMLCVTSELLYAADNTQKAIVSFQVEKDGVGLKGVNEQVIVQYKPDWLRINSMCLCDRSIFISHCQEIVQINAENGECRLLVRLLNQPCVLTKFGSDVLFTNEKKSSVWHLKASGELDVFAGSDNEEGSIDGLVKNYRLKQPIGICTEFDSVVYLCDAKTNSIKLCSKVTECADFLNAIGSLYDAFSVHSKGSPYTVKSSVEAITLVRECKHMLDENTADIRNTTGITGALNGPQGHVSAKTVASVNLIEWGLQRLFDNLKEHDYQVTNLLSCMTLDVENCHSTVHIKQANMSMMEYSRSFGLTMKESIKRVTQWAAYYHTSRKSWYPKPEETIPFSKVPTMQPLPIVKMSQANCDVLRNWAST